MFFEDTMAEVGKFMDSGGPVLWAIVVLLFVMWTLIFERLWYLRSVVSVDVQGAIDTWEARKERQSKHAHQIREKIISEVSLEINTNMMMIKTLIALAPLFGLLGTVTGMITVFDVMAFTGGGDVKAMAGGVSQATVPTMSGMVAALSGVFAMTYVDRMALREQQLLEDHLTMDH
jgi:biopolymer transport protein ExbB